MTGRPLGARLFRALLRILPFEFRGDFGDAMAADFDERQRDPGARVWTRELPSLLATAARQHAGVLRDDVKYGLRLMRRAPGFTALAVLMLALGTGVNAAMFSIVDAVVLRSPFPAPSQLAIVQLADPDERNPTRVTSGVTRDRFAALAADPGPLAAVAALTLGTHVITGAGDPLSADGIECVSASMFDVLRTPPLLGRTFDGNDDRAGAAPTIVLSFLLWRQLGGSPALVGRTLLINGTPVTVAGVMPKGFNGPLSRANVPGWMPIGRPVAGAGNTGCRAGGTVNVFVRVQDRLTRAAAGARLRDATLVPLEARTLEDVQTPFRALTAAVACVLLIACCNVGGLQLERTLARRREMALRLALGASRPRLARQTLTENLLLALAGALAGLAAAWLTLDTIVAMLPPYVPHVAEIEINARVFLAAMAVATAAGTVSGLLPLGQLRRVDPARDLADSMRTGHRRAWARRSLVGVELALSIVVLIGAALMLQTFLTLRPTRPGFDPAHKWIMMVRVRGASPEAAETFFGELLDRLRTTPGLRGAAGTTYYPMSGSSRVASFVLGGRSRNVLTNQATPGYFALLGIPVVAGRAFTELDTRTSMPVLIVNEAFAKTLRADGQVLGHRVALRFDDATGPSPVELTIVGVIGNTRSSGVDTRPRNEAYVPFAQHPGTLLQIIADAEGPAEADAPGLMRAAVRAIRPDLVVAPPTPMQSVLDDRMSTTRFGAWLLGIFAALAVGLAAIGLMTTIGWWVTQRTRELGVRVALGATRGQLSRLVFAQGLAIASVGIAAGCLAATWMTRYLEGWIYGVTPLDPGTFAACAALMLAVAACAVYLPVRRATSVDPVIALRVE